MSDQYVGEIRLFSFPRVPTGWLACNGQDVPISQYQALYSLIGLTYGGDGMTTFGLPDLRGRVPISQGQGPGLPDYALGQPGGAETVQLTVQTMPWHGHSLTSTYNLGSTPKPGTGVHLATASIGGNAGGALYAPQRDAVPFVVMASDAIASAGNSAGHANIMPSLVANFCIATEGVFPS